LTTMNGPYKGIESKEVENPSNKVVSVWEIDCLPRDYCKKNKKLSIKVRVLREGMSLREILYQVSLGLLDGQSSTSPLSSGTDPFKYLIDRYPEYGKEIVDLAFKLQKTDL
jgi:hypothetical protein